MALSKILLIYALQLPNKLFMDGAIKKFAKRKVAGPYYRSYDKVLWGLFGCRALRLQNKLFYRWRHPKILLIQKLQGLNISLMMQF